MSELPHFVIPAKAGIHVLLPSKELDIGFRRCDGRRRLFGEVLTLCHRKLDKINGMRFEHYPMEKLKSEILKILGRYLDLNKTRVFFFGSRVLGKGDDRSDVDVGIEGGEPIASKVWLDIQDAIDNLPTMVKVEVVDFKRVSKEFKEVALQKIEPLQ